MRAALGSGGASPWRKAAGLAGMSLTIGKSILDDKSRKKDPLELSRKRLVKENALRVDSLETEVQAQVTEAVERALAS